MEIVGSKHQTEIGIVLELGWSIGTVTLVGVVWFLQSWFWLQLVISLAFIPFAFALGILSESPRWLQTRGKTGKLKKLLTKAAAVNGRDVQEDFKNLDLQKENEERHTATLFEVLKMTKMRKRLFNMIYQWMVSGFLYYAFSYNITDLAGDKYLNFLISGLVEFPAYALVFWSIKRWGRRPTLVSLMLVEGASFVAILCVPV
ncbi:organic cation transporter protein, partial [Trichonephila clavata]